MKGIVYFFGVDCNNHMDLCEKEKITKFPTVRIFPPLPVPAYDYEGELDGKKVVNEASRYVLSFV